MKTSDALRRADELGLPNLKKKYILENSHEWGGEKPPCCAIGGAAVVTRGVELKEDGWIKDKSIYSTPETDDWERIAHRDTSNCLVFTKYGSISTSIICLYDNHLWSRTRIADWLDTIL